MRLNHTWAGRIGRTAAGGLLLACMLLVNPRSGSAALTITGTGSNGAITFSATAVTTSSLVISGTTDNHATPHTTTMPAAAVAFGNVTPTCIGQPTGTGGWCNADGATGSWNVATFSTAVQCASALGCAVTMALTAYSGYDGAQFYPANPGAAALPTTINGLWNAASYGTVLPTAGTAVDALGLTSAGGGRTNATDTWLHQVGLHVPGTATGALTATITYTLVAGV